MARLSRLDIPTALALVRATWELALGRWRLGTFDFRSLNVDGRQPSTGFEIDRIAFALRAMGTRVPWRADCLVQALAGQHWLASRGVGSTIHLGVKASEAPVDAHAWLTVGDRVILGGEVADYSEFPLHKQH